MGVRRVDIGKALAILLVCGAMAACGRGQTEKKAVHAKQKETEAKQPARIVHAVASDLFPAGAPIDDRATGVQALKSLINWIASGEDVDADALVLVGDLGLSAPAPAATPPVKQPEPPTGGAPPAPPPPAPTQTPAVSADTAARAKVIADVLATGPRSVPIYLVPGGRRLAAGADLKQTLIALQSAVAEVTKALPAASITLVDLSRCYAADAIDMAQCTARVPDHQVKLVGYPAFAYSGDAPAASLTEQKRWTDAFVTAIPAQDEGSKTLVIAPVYSPLADQWPESQKAVRDAWLKAAGNAAAGIGIIAPSMVRQRYESGEPWTENGLLGRWFPTPPLITAAAGNHPIQGASVISVGTDSTDQQVFWYSAFRPGAASRSHHTKETWFSRWVRRPFAFLWRLGDLSPLARTALFAVAFLAAFLTAVAVWQIPPATTALATATAPAAPAAGAAAGSTTPPAAPTTTAAIQSVTTTTFLSGNFARTVLSGVGGLAIVTLILDELWTNSKPQAQGYYVVWFVFFFVMFLWLSSFFRGLIEGVRAVIVATSPVPVVGKGQNLWLTFTAWARRIGRRFWWFLVVAADTTFNVVQGRNDVKPFFLAETIVDLQLSALVTIDRVRESLTSAIEQLVKTKLPQAQLAAGDIRVSVSVLADDENQAFYVSKPTQNLSTQFGPKSVAWVAVMIGQARWWVENKAYQDIELFDNTGQVIPLPHPAAKMMMKDYYQQRKADYEAFIVIPIPLRQRGTGVRRAGLHISFAKKAYMDAVWAKFADEPYGMPAANVPSPPPAAYPKANDILVETDAELRALLKQSIEVIEAALRGFNEVLFWNDPRLHRRS